MIDRIGERRILTVSYSALIFVFLGYALIPHASVLYVLYCLDSLLYLSTIALTTYLSKIADPRDIVPSLSMGVTMNHLAAVAVPVAGGLIWSAVGYRATFLAGAAVVVASLVLARRIGTRPEV
jgi:predicted MFS family arabinose efflux permease